MLYKESTTVELKSEVTSDINQGVIALANTDGGTIYIGIDNNGRAVGVSNPDEVMAQVGNMIRDGIKPDLTAYTSITEKYFADAGLPFTQQNRRTLKLVDADGYYANAGLLLSDQCEHSIKCAVYEGTGTTKFKGRKEFLGAILKQVDEAFEYVQLNNNQNSMFDGLKRVEHPDYPPEAIREALLNAVIHRDYDYSGSLMKKESENPAMPKRSDISSDKAGMIQADESTC